MGSGVDLGTISGVSSGADSAVDPDHSGIDLGTKAWNNYLIRGGLQLVDLWCLSMNKWYTGPSA